jgi:predicted HTH domain antitoxin
MAGVTIPDDLLELAGLTEEEVRAEFALEMYRREKLSMGRAVELVGKGHVAFWRMMATRDIYMHYDVEDLEQDIANLRSLGRL